MWSVAHPRGAIIYDAASGEILRSIAPGKGDPPHRFDTGVGENVEFVDPPFPDASACIRRIVGVIRQRL
jgi:hypothetical protein